VDGINQAYGDRPGNRDAQCKFSKTDFARIAEDMGCVGIRVESPEGIAPAFKKALSLNRPVVVDVVTDLAAGLQVPGHRPSNDTDYEFVNQSSPGEGRGPVLCSHPLFPDTGFGRYPGGFSVV